MAVDTSDVAAGTAYSEQLFAAFTFGGLLIPSQSITEKTKDRPELRYVPQTELESVDKLILQYLFVHRADRYLILDPHAEEILNLRDARQRAWNRTAARLFNANMGRFHGFLPENLDNILQFLRSAAPSKQPDEWNIFRQRFLPNWRAEMLDAVWNASESLASIDDWIRRGRYLFLRDANFGDRSLLHFLDQPRNNTANIPKIDWHDYEQYAQEPETIERFVQVHDVIEALMKLVNRKERRQTLVDRASERDARAFAIIHTWNSYFDDRKINARLELVTRSPTLHSVLASLREGTLHVTLRHPFLLPDIYQFDSRALAAIGGVLNRLDVVLAPYLRSTGQFGDQAPTRDTAYATDAQEAAQSVVPLLRDVLSIQQALEQPPDVFEEIYHSTVDRPAANVSDTRHRSEPMPLKKIEAVFEAIRQQLRNRSDPFSRDATLTLIERNSALVDFEAARVFSKKEAATFRVFDFRGAERHERSSLAFGSAGMILVPCITLRCVDHADSAFSRIVFVHSTRMIALLSKHETVPHESNIHSPTEWKIRISVILDGIKRALEALRAGDLDRSVVSINDMVFNLDATLVACLVFANKRRFDTVISLASTILHQLSDEIRRGSERSTRSASDARLGLAYRELFLLRHFCERAAAVDGYARARSSSRTIAKEFSRAKRDLDFAALMSEDAEHCLSPSSGTDSIVPPGGTKSFNDYRLRLAHLGGWTEQFLIAIDDSFRQPRPSSDWLKNASSSPRRGFGIWAAAGMVRETLIDAYTLHEQRTARAPKSRLDKHQQRYLAYVEMRALQGALTIFLIFLAYRVAPDMHSFWSPNDKPLPDRVFIFRDWHAWWTRYRNLVKDFKFKVRADSLINSICSALGEIAKLQAKSERRGISADYARIVQDLLAELRAIIDRSGPNAFVNMLGTALEIQLKALTTEERSG